jgi:DNA-binding response OmpR family regulator
MTQPVRILILEDEWLLAELVEDAVREFGFEVVGPVPSVKKAMELVESENITAAILDVSLGGGEKSFSVARALTERRIPFLFVTGYQDADLPVEFGDRTMLCKPVRLEALRDCLDGLVGPLTIVKSTPELD